MIREEDILRFIKDNHICSLDSIFTKGKIPKSKKTLDVVRQLVKDKKIVELTNENGKKRYIVYPVKIPPERTPDLLRLLSGGIIFLLKKAKVPNYLIVDFKLFLRYRVEILEKEAKNMKTPIAIDDMLKIVKRVEFFMQNPLESFDKTSKWIKKEIERDRYYLTHQFRGLSVNSKIHDPVKKRRQTVAPSWQPRNRAFQTVKNARMIRPVSDKLNISKDRYEYGLSRPNQLYHAATLKSKSKDPAAKFDEIFKRLSAEYGRNLVKNPDSTYSEQLASVCKERLDIIKKDHSESKNYRVESKELSNTIKFLEKNTTWLVDEWKKKELEDL